MINSNTENNKYYTPTLDEFFIGFEYEGYRDEFCPDHNKEWIDLSFGRWTSPRSHEKLLELIETNKIRVKYLDKEDMELLFKNKLEYTVIEFEEDNVFEFSFYKSGCIITVLYTYYDKMISFYSDDDCIFKGIISNISELKKLLPQLIIE